MGRAGQRRGGSRDGRPGTTDTPTTGRSGGGRGGRSANRSSGRSGAGRQSRPRSVVDALSRTIRDVENQAQRGALRRSGRDAFQAVALVVRSERDRLKTATGVPGRTADLKKLDAIATSLAKVAARDPSLLALLADDAKVSDGADDMRLELLRAGGIEPAPEPEPEAEPAATSEPARPSRGVVPQSVLSRQLANPFLQPDFEAGATLRPVRARRLAGWELLTPLFRAFEERGGPSCMDLPEPAGVRAPAGQELMRHQAQVVQAAADGHRTFLLADEPGLGKTAQALMAAQAADAFPLLAVVPNVVKRSWAREAELWVPGRSTTVVHGDGNTVDGFADVVVVNYEVLDRHVGWLGDHGFRAMVVDEAHFIKNKTSQRSRHVLELSQRIRERTARPLLMALTGTPLINDIEDFRAIWQFLGWIDDTKPVGDLMAALEDNGLVPSDPGFYRSARQTVVDTGIVRRRKVDVASDIPARRVADLPVELDDESGRSIRAAERELAARLVKRYESALVARGGDPADGIDHDLVRKVAGWERADTSTKTGDNVFSVLRRIGQAKAGLAADYAAQLARNVGKVVFFAKHVDVMDAAEQTFAARGLRYSSIRGDQTPKARQENVDAFLTDPDVAVVVCSLTAAGVGLNLQVASDVVLAELSWTDAEQTQAIDRVHRIGQENPVTAWRVIAAQTVDTRIAQLIDSKAGLAARAVDGSDEDVDAAADVQLEALVTLLTDALAERRLDTAAGPGEG
ncbi:DEAD/DEAH box helicase [Thalassiella azotivora]